MGSMTPPRRHTRRVFFAAVSLALLLPGPAGVANDSDLFANRVDPNVMFIFDNSWSMNTIVWHPAYRTDFVYDPVSCSTDPTNPDYKPYCLEFPLCNVAGDNDLVYGFPDSLWWDDNNLLITKRNKTVTECGNQRLIYVDPILATSGYKPPSGKEWTIWQDDYLKWYFSDNADPYYDDIIATANGQYSDCRGGGTYSKYRRARINAAKDILREVICDTNQLSNFRYGLAIFDGDVDEDTDVKGGYVLVSPDDYDASHVSALNTAINNIRGRSYTPLGETLYNVYRFFQSRDTNRQAFGKNPAERFPVYNLNTSGNIGTAPPHPVEWDCQRHFVVLLTDGEPTKDDFDDMSKTAFLNDLIGDYVPGPPDTDETPPNLAMAPGLNADSCDGDGSADEDSCEVGLYLDDIAKFMTEHDFMLEDEFPSEQVIETYTVGFTTTVVTNDLLERTATAGNGKFFYSTSAEELAANIDEALDAIRNKSMSFTAATVPASRTTDGDNFYTSYFLPREGTAFWEGHLKNFDFSPFGDILTEDGFCATGDQEDVVPAPTCPASGRLRTYAPGFWDAAAEMPDPGDRNLFVEFGATPMFDQPAGWNTSEVAPSDLRINPLIDANQEPYLSAGLTTGPAIARALIDVIAGCEFNSDPCVPRTNDAGEKIYLGDIFHSNPMVVGSPSAPVNEAAYHDFATNHRTRTRVIYAGANDGFLHGFNAGNWQTKVLDADGNPTAEDLIPPRHDRGTGEELFGFMPYSVRIKIKNLPKQDDTIRDFETVDGSPIVADAWFYRDVSGDDLTTLNPTLTPAGKVEEQWRTVLIAGMRNGGRTYYALDISEPTAQASDVSSDYPRYLWGFPCEIPNAFCSGTDHFPVELPQRGYRSYMGLTWSEPVITRVRVAVDGGDPRGYERWVAIFGAGYDPASDPNAGTDSGGNPVYNVDTLNGRAIFMVDITTGDVLAMKYYHPDDESIDGEQIGYKEMKYAFASAPAVFDLNFDGFADVIYIGDLGGNLWKWVVNRVGDDPINNSGTSPDANFAQPDWPFRLFFTASPSASPPERQDPPGAFDPSIHYQSFFFPPTGVLRNNKLILAFGAGERADPIGPPSRFDDGSASDNNHYYVVKDSDPLARNPSAPDPIDDALTEADLADFDDPSPLDCGAMKATKQGYYITARDAEKFITNSVVFLGTVYTGSFIPPDPDVDDPCDASGDSYIYAFDLECGLGTFTGQPGGPADKRRKAIGDGIPTRPRVSVGDLNQPSDPSDPCKNKVVVITSDGDISNDCGGDVETQGINIRSWRER